jgi:glycosyltransferase involved in cell wall biosynthesis
MILPTDTDVIDVICPIYNHASYIQQCLTSILNQQEVFVLIHVIDDASTDDSVSIVKSFSNNYPTQIKLYANPINHGNAVESIAANKLDLIGKYWTYIEGDDFFVNDRKFISQIEHLKQNNDVIATATRCVLWDLNTGIKKDIKPDLDRWNFHDLVTKKNSSKMYCHISSIVWKSETHRLEHQLSPIKSFQVNESVSEVFLVHKILKESQKYMDFQDIEGSCYRYTGKGLWSRLSVEDQEILNLNLQISIDAITPIWMRVKNKVDLFTPRFTRLKRKLEKLVIESR